ncbi:MAG: hypothetical protein IT545_14960 [Rhodobacteraceae bacterium]|nr:hypothetical protein [Paracoccaceae bacterium]
MSLHAIARAAAVAALLPLAAAAQEGRYRVEGTNLDGTPYSGEAEITLTSDTTCAIRWTTGPTSSDGICMRYSNAFAAAYILDGEPGLAIYLLLNDGSLEGYWTVSGASGNGTEMLTPLK